MVILRKIITRIEVRNMEKINTLEDEFKKNEEFTEECFKDIKDWCRLQTYLPKMSDVLLATFLHSCYYKLEPTKDTIQNYYKIRSQAPEIFADRDPFTNNLVNGKPVVEFSMLTNTTEENYRVLFVKFGITESDKFCMVDVCKSFVMYSDLDLYLRGSCPGWVILFDAKGLSFGHLTKINLSALRKTLAYLQDAMPVRLKGWHIININSILTSIFGMVKPFLKKDLVEMLHFHNQIDTLYKSIPKKILPREYGGEEKSTEELMRIELEILQKHKRFFEEELKFAI